MDSEDRGAHADEGIDGIFELDRHTEIHVVSFRLITRLMPGNVFVPYI